MTNEQIINKLNDLYLEQMKIETITEINRYEIRLLIDKIKADATTTTNS